MAGGTEALVASLDRNDDVVKDKGWEKWDGCEETGSDSWRDFCVQTAQFSGEEMASGKNFC